MTTKTATRTRLTATVVAAVAAMAIMLCTAVTTVSAITTKPTGAAVIKTTLQILPSAIGDATAASNDQQQQPSFAARYWQQQRDFGNGPSTATYGDGEYDDTSALFAPQKLSAAQQEHILDDVRRHNQQQHWWTAPGPGTTTTTAATSRTDAAGRTDGSDQLQELLQINGVAAGAENSAAADNHGDDRHGRQRSAAIGGGSDGWLPQSQPPQFFNNYNRQPQQQQQPPALSPYFAPPTASHVLGQQPQYYPSTSSAGPAVQQYNQKRNQQQPQIYATTPSSSVSSSAGPNEADVDDRYGQHQQRPQPTHYPQRPVTPAFGGPPSTTAVTVPPRLGDDDHGGDIDAALEEQIRQQLTAVAGSGGVNYTVLNAADGIADRLREHVVGSTSGDQGQYVQIGGGPSPSRNRVQQPQLVAPPAAVAASASGNKNTVVKTVVVRQKPSPKPAAAEPTAATEQQHTWTVSEQQQLEQLARQVLPPGVAQYEIIRAGGVDGGKSGDKGGDAVTADNAVPIGGVGAAQPSSAAGKKKPVTFVILEEHPDGTVRVRGVEKKRPGGATAADDAEDGAAADDEQLQQLVDKLNKGELRLPTAGPSSSPPSRTPGADSSSAASTTATAPLPAFIQQSSLTATPSPPGGFPVKSRNPPPSPYFPSVAVTPQTVSDAPDRDQFQNFFLPTVLPTASVATTTAGMAGQQQHRYRPPQPQPPPQPPQQRHPTPAVIAAASSTTPAPANSTLSFFNNNFNYNKAATKEGKFSGALRRRGYYAMAKYMRQAGIDAVLEETGPFTIFVPTDKAFRALLVQLGGPDRAEDKFRENPRLLIGLLLHHVVPGAFKSADLKAGDEMTGVSLAGTQLRANLYARQLYDNRWNDIEVLTVNGARVLEDVASALTGGADDGYASADDVAGGSVQQRRDMVLSSDDDGEQRAGPTGHQQIVAVGHAVDRVLFPLPVGDVLATMRADRQRRYSVFLRAVDEYCSPSVRSLLSGSRTVTVFAPVDEAFRVRRGSGNHSSAGGVSGSIADGLFRDDGGGRLKKRNRRRVADRFVLSHVVLAGPGDPPMYTAGLRFYQVRDTAYRLPVGGGDGAGANGDGGDDDNGGTAEDGNGGWDDGHSNVPPTDDGETPRYYQLTVYKDSGRIRLNGGVAQVLVRNVPATNGVLHGIDAPLV